MRFINRRMGWIVEGKFVTIIQPGIAPTVQQMLAFYHLKPSDARYAALAAPMRYGRCVLLKNNGNFVVAPITPDVSEITA